MSPQSMVIDARDSFASIRSRFNISLRITYNDRDVHDEQTLLDLGIQGDCNLFYAPAPALGYFAVMPTQMVVAEQVGDSVEAGKQESQESRCILPAEFNVCRRSVPSGGLRVRRLPSVDSPQVGSLQDFDRTYTFVEARGDWLRLSPEHYSL